MSFATVLSLPPPVAEIGGVPAHDADLHCGRWSMRRNGRPSIGCLPRRTSSVSKSANGRVPRRPFSHGPYFAVRQQKTKGQADLHRVAFETVP